MCRSLSAVALLVVLGISTEAAHGQQIVAFPTPGTPPKPIPPLVGTSTPLPNVFRPPVESRERIVVGVDGRGDVLSVTATQRLLLRQKADYRLTIPAPVLDVEPGPGSESTPGQRTGAIIWQGFAGGRKILSARARLVPAAAARGLPLAIEIVRSGQATTVRLRNTTGATVSTFSADARPIDVARILDALRADPAGGSLGQAAYVTLRTATKPVKVRVAAPLLVTGTVASNGPQVRLVLGGSRPLVRDLRVAAADGKVRIRLVVRPLAPTRLLRPPQGRTWTAAVRRSHPDGRRLLAQAIEISLTLGSVRQYQTYLGTPDPSGRASASYVYRQVQRAAPAVPSESDGRGLGAVAIGLLVAGAILAVGGAAVAWAHS